MNIVLILSLLAAGSTTILATKWPEKDGVPCACSRLHDPVCGSDGQDYPNGGCARSCGKVRSFTRGTCYQPVQPLPDLFVEQLHQLRSMEKERVKKDQVCACPAIYSPVCGRKNRIWREYASQCVAECSGVETTKPGTCKKSCVCHRMYSPVCARKPDGTLRDYSNDCTAECDDAVILRSGQCEAKPDNSLPRHVKKASEPRCICTKIYRPVCAEDWAGVRNVYASKCVAECAKATYIQDGTCNGPALLPVLPEVKRPPGLQLLPNDADDSDDLDAAQLPWLDELADDSDDSDLVANQLPVFPSLLFKRRAQN